MSAQRHFDAILECSLAAALCIESEQRLKIRIGDGAAETRDTPARKESFGRTALLPARWPGRRRRSFAGWACPRTGDVVGTGNRQYGQRRSTGLLRHVESFHPRSVEPQIRERRIAEGALPAPLRASSA